MPTVTSNKLIEARRAVNLTQREAAIRLQCSSTSLWKYEQGETSPTVEFLFRAARVYGRNASWFLETEHRRSVDWHHVIGKLSSDDRQRVKEFIDYLKFRSTVRPREMV